MHRLDFNIVGYYNFLRPHKIHSEIYILPPNEIEGKSRVQWERVLSRYNW